jgi:hypothetical protein
MNAGLARGNPGGLKCAALFEKRAAQGNLRLARWANWGIVRPMKTMTRSTLFLIVFLAAGLACGALPKVNVTVADSSGKQTYKGATDAKGSFATSALKPGNYVVQFSSSSAPKGSQYSLVISAGKKKVMANGVAAEKFAGGGVAMKIDVGAGLNISGQVATEEKNSSAPMGKNGKPMVWIGKKLGSNIAAHWAESDSAEAKEAMTTTSMSRRDLQNRQNQSISGASLGSGN